ncbi:Gti1/Pac2 family-domain-containing protein [Hypoxylon sp. FL0890]|nr:Gti1/Pac2 family-domain-containing protein [Hypoxylon sp. FL0890]
MSSGGIMSGSDRPPSGGPLLPTFTGYISSTMDALILFEACLRGVLFHVPRRPHDRERSNLIVSGNVFIYEEHSSGIKRWTDGVPWSPSRILGNFLLYRELDKPFQPGEKKRAMKRSKPDGGVGKPSNSSRSNSIGGGMASSLVASGPSISNFDAMSNGRSDAERALVGSLIDSYQFKHDGLVKKTISVTYNGIQHHMVSYYNIEDVVRHKLRTPSTDPSLRGVVPRGPLISSGSFRAPVDDHEIIMTEPHMREMLGFNPYNSYQMNGANGAGTRSLSVPSMPSFTQPAWGAPDQYVSSYSMAPAPTLPPPTSYPSIPPPTTTYSYETSSMAPYGMTPRSSTGFHPPAPLSSRRHSNIHGVNGIGHMDYSGLGHMNRTPMSSAPMTSTQILSNVSNLTNHGLSDQTSFSNASMFEASAATAAAAAVGAAPSSNHHHDGYEHSSSNQTNDPYSTESSSRQPVGFNDHLENSFNSQGSHQASADFGASLPEHTAHNLGTSNLGSSSHDATPPTMHLGLENSEPSSNAATESEWTSGFMSTDSFPQLGVPPRDFTTS